MKKALSLFSLVFPILCFAQGLTVNTTTYSVPQLVNNILINSPCATASNISWITGTTFGSSNGIGYFQNTNPNFPMQSGVILSSGSATSAPGPNNSELNDGIMNWLGDTNLETTLLQSGTVMKSTNATVLEFDFLPISSTFSFDFLFASEEYGDYQCEFSDAFAFLLTNMTTGVTTNLAVVPNTTEPISVVTIRDFSYNSACPSVNANYFGTYNGDSSATGSATNFNGQTKLINAHATLIPNTPYHIKLVIADRLDSDSDSAIFLSSNTFNIGQDVLGPDLTVAANNAVCYGTTYAINSGLNPALYSFLWKKNGNTIVGATGPSLNITQAGVYQLTYQNTVANCQPVTDNITIEYFPQITTTNPIPLYKCNSGAANYSYDLSVNTPIVKTGLNPLTTVSYYNSSSDAALGINALPTNYIGIPGETVYVKIKSHLTPCFVIKSFSLLTAPGPVAYQPLDMTLCAGGTTINTAVFNFSLQNTAVLNGQSATMNLVSYYTSSLNATNGTNPISSTSYSGANNTPIYVRVQNATDYNCFSITNFTLFVNPLPPVDSVPNSIIICNNYTLPPLTNGNYFSGPNGSGTPLFAGHVIHATQTIYIFSQPSGTGTCSAGSSFLVTIIDPLTLTPSSGTYCAGHILPALIAGNYYTAAGGPGGTGTLIPVGTNITTTKIIYVYFKSIIAPFCVINDHFTVTIIPKVVLASHPNVFDCTAYILPPLTEGNYFTATDGGGTPLAAGTPIMTTQPIYIFSDSGAPGVCKSEISFMVYIGLNAPANVSQCNGYTLPVLPIGSYYSGPAGTGNLIPAGTVINETKTIYIYIPNSTFPNCTDSINFIISIVTPVDTLPNTKICESYTLPSLTYGNYYTGTNTTGTMLHAGDIITTTKTLYIFNGTLGLCANQSHFTITINPKPLIDSRASINAVCNSYQLTALSHGKYYTGPGGSGTMLPSGTLITTSQTIYIFALNNSVPPCTAENSFTIGIVPIVADDPGTIIACNSYTLLPLNVGNYYTQSGGPYTAGNTMLHAGDVILTSRTLYVFAETGTRKNCTDEKSFSITINITPLLTAFPNINACDTYILPALTLGNYYTASGGTGTLLHAGDPIKTSQTLFVFAQTGPNCTDEKSFNLNLFNVDDLVPVSVCEKYLLPALTVGNYYTGPAGSGTLLHAGQTINQSQTLYIYASSPFSPTCTDQSLFVLTIKALPVVNAIPSALTTVCDTDTNNDGFTLFPFDPLLDAALLGTQTTSEFSITYYASQADAENGSNPLVATNAHSVFAKVSNSITGCSAIQNLPITVIKAPEPNRKGGSVCIDSQTGALLNPYTIESGLNAATHTFQWQNAAGMIVGTASQYQTSVAGTFTLLVTSSLTGCTTAPIPIVITTSEPARVSYTLTNAFADNQIVTLIASGVGGDYEYQLDSGAFQDSPIFQNVSSGVHTATVKDKNGCADTTLSLLVINYPKFFTPNTDGYNDSWNIWDLKDQRNSAIFIYDRYGKLLKELKPFDPAGWDGTFNGSNLPSTDYWFTVDYEEHGNMKKFRAHFAMKR